MTAVLDDFLDRWLDWVLAAATLILWAAMYGIYLARETAFRRWLALTLWRMQSRRWARLVPGGRAPVAPPLIVRAPRPPPTLRAPVSRVQALAQPQPAPAEVAPVRISEWRAGHLPLRYRLLGQVRRPANDN